MSTEPPVEIRDDGATDRYFHVMLNMADDELNPYEYRLLGHYRRVCGAQNVPCTEGTRKTAERCKMSAGKVSETRAALAAAGWIKLAEDGNRVIVTLIDRMPENVARYSADKRSPDERSPHERSGNRKNVHRMNVSFTSRTKRSPHERKRSPGERKKELIKKQPPKEPAKTSSSSDRGDRTGGEQVDDDGFIRNQAELIGLSRENCEKLLAVGVERATGLLIAARRKAKTNPAGLLLAMLGSEQPPSADDLSLVPLAAELGTTEPDRLDREQRARQLRQLTARQNGSERTPAAPEYVKLATRKLVPPLPPEQPPFDPPAPVEVIGLDEKPGGTLTIREIWQATLGQLQMQLNRDTYAHLRDAKAVRFEDGILTVQPRPHAVRTFARLQTMLDQVVSGIAGAPISVRAVNEAEPAPAQ